MPSPRPTPAAVRAALSAWMAAGLPVGRLTIGPKGEIIIEALPEPREPSQNKGPKKWGE